MSMFPHTVTVYNSQTVESPETGFTPTLSNYITVLHGVLLDASKAVNVRTSGMEGADAVNLYIPFDVEATDGVTGAVKQYASPMEFWGAADKSQLWTLSLKGNGGNTFFVKGEAVEPDKTEEYINLKYDGVYTVTKVDEKDFGSLKHWEVGGA